MMNILALGITIIAAAAISAADIPASKVSDDALPSLTVTRGAMRLGPIAERKMPRGDKLRYGVICPMQIGPRTAAAFVNRAIYESYWNYDAEDGNDIFIFDDLNKLSAAKPLPLNRSGVEPDPKYNNAPRQFIRFPINGGFVPHGALCNGRPHPYAGTGYALGQVLTFPAGPNGTFSYESSPIGGSTDFFQFSYDGKEFKIVSKVEINGLMAIPNSPWKLRNTGMACAIPDGMDLLQACVADSEGKDAVQGTGICRWQNIDGQWQPVEFTPIAISSKAEEHTFYEPSLIRAADGKLLFTARDDGRQNRAHPAWGNDIKQDINVWEYDETAKGWKHIVYVKMLRTGPMSIGRTADGVAYVLGNPILDDKKPAEMRATLYMWPLNPQRNGLMKPLVVCDARQQFGEGYNGLWNVDHPVTTILRLADGKLHGIVAYRVRDPHFISGKERSDPEALVTEPSPQAGAYIEETLHTGEEVPIWEFADYDCPIDRN